MAEEEALDAVGPVPPDVVAEADATPPDERTAEVARICAVLEAADRGTQAPVAAGAALLQPPPLRNLQNNIRLQWACSTLRLEVVCCCQTCVVVMC